MAQEGRLTADKFGFDTPVDAPLYAKPPIDYRDVHTISVSYETDMDAALDLLPEGLVIEPPAVATVLFIDYPFSTLGPYYETILGISCSFEGTPRSYIAHIVVNNEMPLAAGREIWGFPKKLADISIETGAPTDLLSGKMERPSGHLICSAGVRPETPAQVSGEPQEGYSLSLRLIPSPVEGAKPSLAELVETHSVSTTKQAWTGPGWVEFHSHSQVDPWHKLKVKEVVNANYRIYDTVLGFGRVVRTY
jgi:acetoacetate decarboxylase|tara:strand:- start:1869 stop:2615 length:747 start_codon:yes stop_codon:yes gene_type:complete